MDDLPTGTVTFLLTDVEHSTDLWERDREAMRVALLKHDTIINEAVEQFGGVIVGQYRVGDSRLAVFAQATDAVAASGAAQQALTAETWPPGTSLRVRIALHTGEANVRDGAYYGATVNRAAHLCSIGYGGQTLLSSVTQALVQDRLPDGVAAQSLGFHRLADLSRPQHVYQLFIPGVPAAFPPLPTLDNRPTNLPSQPTPFIGREREVTVVRERLLQPDTRLVTLTGAGGIGKTRLALQVAADLLDTFVDGVYFVNLAPVSDPSLVASTIAQTVGVQEGSRPLLESLKGFLQDRRMLLLLDNFEQVVAAGPMLTELLSAAPHTKALITSRAILHVYGEQEFLVEPLSLPDPMLPTHSDLATSSEAVELFVRRAQVVRPDFELNTTNAAVVTDICRRLEGLPLPIELAVARLKVLSPKALLDRLGNRLELLVGGPRDIPARQQTLRGTLDWSFMLLDATSQELFASMGVFTGGCTLEAAEAVCGGVGRDDLDLLDGIQGLLDISLLRRVEITGEPRFSMLDTVRDYALEALTERGQRELLRRRHAEYFMALVERAKPELEGGEQVGWLDRLAQEHDNLRATLSWALEDGSGVALRLSAALWPFWSVHGYLSEGRAWLERALAGGDRGQAADRAQALLALADLTDSQNDYAQAIALYEQSLAMWRELGDTHGIATVFGKLALCYKVQGDYARAAALYGRSLELWRGLGDIQGVAKVLGNLALIARSEGKYEQAELLLRESLVLFRKLGDPQGIARSLNNLGLTLLSQGKNTDAIAPLEESLSIFRARDEKNGIANVLSNLASAAHAKGMYATAASLFDESLDVFVVLKDRYGIAECLEGLAKIAGTLTLFEQAARLFGASETVRATIGAPLPLAEQRSYDTALRAASAAHGEEKFAAAKGEGSEMTLEQAVTYARDVAHRAQRTTTVDATQGYALPEPASGRRHPANLSEREVEVLRLTAQGLTYKEIADRLIISPRTVNRHLTSIYTKLNVASRHAATIWAREHQLI